MNPMTNVKNIKKLSEQELRLGNPKSSWHDQYKSSAWLFVGGLPYDLTEGDIVCVFSQYGEVVNLNLVRDKGTGKSKGFCFLCYEDQRSTNLAVDNFNGIKILGRTIRVDHVSDYKPPKDSDKLDNDTRKLYSEGCAPKLELEPELLPAVTNIKKEKKEKKVKVKKEKKRKKKKKKAKVESSSSSSSESSSSDSDSDTDDSEESVKKRKQSRKKKAKNSKRKAQNSSSSESDEASHKSAKTKRQQLEAKIKALEMALSTVKQSSKKAALNDANSNNSSGNNKFKGESVDNQRQYSSSDDYVKEKSRQSTDRRKHDYEVTGKRGEDVDSVKSKERSRERSDKERRSGRERSQSPLPRERTRDKYKS